MATITVPTRETVNPTNQQVFDQLEKGLGFVPNLYAAFAYSDNALPDYLALQNRESTLTKQEKEIVNLVVSQVNDCAYCLAAHTALGKMVGFTDDQLLAIRGGKAPFNDRYDALASFVQQTTELRGKPNPAAVDALLAAGYSKANLVDIVVAIGDKIITNYLHGVTEVPVDFPAAPALEPALT